MLLIQYSEGGGTRVGRMEGEGGRVLPLRDVRSTYELAQRAIERGGALDVVAAGLGVDGDVAYDALYSQGRVLPPLTHPDPAHCLVSGTGLTHLGSAASRDAMHRKLAQADAGALTDSMKMFRIGLEGGRPAAGAVGAAPEWFYKGDGGILRGSGQPLESPGFAQDGGDEVEVVGLYLVGPDGTPWRVGHALGNEFSDHVLEQANYLYLAHSKLRPCSVGPALVTGALPDHVAGQARLRDASGHVRWEKEFLSGEANMSHSLANLEHHHFKYGAFHRPGDVHVHFFGAAVLSFADGVRATPGDAWEIEAPGFGPALVNRLVVENQEGAAEVRML
ncbi:MAG TPA: AraD1 family protein [Burkholderiaceae bacterium]|nr:AraD1 family protein [Burkholderiaceae bacterium]